MNQQTAKPEQSRYLVSSRILKLKARGKVQRIVGWCASGFFLIGGTGVLIENKKPEDFTQNLIIYLCFLAISLCVLYFGLKNQSLITAANRYASLFAADRDGTATLKELSDKTAKPEDKVRRELDKLFNLGVFQNCSLEKGGEQPGVVLSDVQLDRSAVGFITVKCPNCTGTTRIRFGTVGKCDWCGSPIRGEK